MKPERNAQGHPEIRGMVGKVSHLVAVEEISGVNAMNLSELRPPGGLEEEEKEDRPR